ncbi:MAG: Na+/H+ antiporter NhaA [Anaerolineales bacterium]|nr:Na+/H+ antiporter NhaA [Anaerolineales bacterium]
MPEPRPTKPSSAERLLYPFQEFLHQEASGGILLLICTGIALLWANSPFSGSYHQLWQTKMTLGVNGFILNKPLLLWINDGLMAVFFFVVGLEIKRELLVGELASARKAALPLASALGGILVPALIYLLFNPSGPGRAGWGIPMATDIAFALGVLVLLGKRIPLSLKVFLTALAIVDDIAAVLVIALFYTAEIAWINLAAAAGLMILLLIINRLGVHHPLVYALLGIGLWLAFLTSGVHATVAGVLLALTIPARARSAPREFAIHSRAILNEFENACEDGENITKEQHGALQALEKTAKNAEAPLQRLEHTLHPWVAFFIMPVFALANAGVTIGADFSSAAAHPISLGIVAGLILGKQIGITSFAWMAVKTRLAELPRGISWRLIYGASWLAGIGFTMSLFIASLAFDDPAYLYISKVGILMASLFSGITGWAILRGTRSR